MHDNPAYREDKPSHGAGPGSVSEMRDEGSQASALCEASTQSAAPVQDAQTDVRRTFNNTTDGGAHIADVAEVHSACRVASSCGVILLPKVQWWRGRRARGPLWAAIIQHDGTPTCAQGLQLRRPRHPPYWRTCCKGAQSVLKNSLHIAHRTSGGTALLVLHHHLEVLSIRLMQLDVVL